MFTIDVEAESLSPVKQPSINNYHLISLETADKNILCKSSKKDLIEILSSLKKFEAKVTDKLIQRFRRLTKDTVKVSVICLTVFSLYCQAIRLADHLITIEPNQTSQNILLYLIRRFYDFFWKNTYMLGPKNDFIFDKTACHLRIPKHNITVSLSCQALHFNRLFVCRQRHMAEMSMIKQKQLRKEALQKDKEVTYDQLPWDPVDMKAVQDDFLRSELLDLDDACIIIQCAERMYQAHARGIYMVEVRKKAMDLHNKDVEVDPEVAARKIQARTRGFLARKSTKLLRESENTVLGISPISLIKQRSNFNHGLSSYPPASPLFSCVDSTSGQPLATFEFTFKAPKSIQHVIDQLHNSIFASDPLENILENNGHQKLGYGRFNSQTESLFSKLLNLGVVLLGPEPCAQFDELISYTVEVTEGKEQLYWDLRSYLYMVAIIPNVLSTWQDNVFKKRNILLVGSKQSGRHAWARAMAQKCGAVHIIINGKSLPRRKRSKIIEKIQQFCILDKNVFVIFDTMDIYNEKYIKKSSHIKKFLFNLLETWTTELENNIQIIGISVKANLEEKVMDLFPITVTIGVPKPSEKIEVIAERLSKRHENSKSEFMPSRLIELNKSTKNLNIGMTMEKIDKKQQRRNASSHY
ncbi:unnamed protein product [Bursaphelenchus okinawaensis]|uniref:ATPase AAA-type core domain-containing protein n=1 Tax=Bursaphelenchus okinawaensis TaxID=465554 RepID=A0A811LMW4_9BILA|nr:unnamed protein product [Bursaphelenchus okinawaensis]CAG9125696.1 unnamed protein product [Bursaphelenchus okinawaensis]